MIKIKIVSDGTRRGTSVMNADTGEELYGVNRVTWSIDSNNKYSADVIVTFQKVPVELLAEAEALDLQETNRLIFWKEHYTTLRTDGITHSATDAIKETL